MKNTMKNAGMNAGMNADRLLELYDRIADAPDAIARLRRFVLDLAVRGKLAEQDPTDEPASELLKRIAAEKARLVKAGEIRKPKELSAIDTDELFFDPPSGWIWSRLLEISRKIHYGYTASADKTIESVRLIRITDIQNNRVEWLSVPGCEIDKKILPQFTLENGDVLIARTGGTIGKSFLVQEIPVTAVFASYLIRVQGSREIYDWYLKIFLESSTYWTQLEEGARGAGQPNVNGQALGKLLVPLPPLAEQHCIVAKVDELMALLDQLEAARTGREAARDRLTAASLARLTEPGTDAGAFPAHARFALDTIPALTTRPDQIKALRQTILNLAVRGKLVEQDPTDEPASELLKRIAAEKARLVKAREIRKKASLDPEMIEPPHDIPASWRWAALGSVFLYDAGTKHEPKLLVPSFWLLELEDIEKETGRLLNRISATERESRSTKSAFLVGDILYGKLRPYLTKVIVADAPGYSTTEIVAIRPFVPLCPEYCALTLRCSDFVNYVTRIGQGTKMPRLRTEDAVVAPFPLPPLAEQHRIVAKVHELMALLDQLETSLTTTNTTRQYLLEVLLHEALAPVKNREAAA